MFSELFFIQGIEKWPDAFKGIFFRQQEFVSKGWFWVKIDDVLEIPTQQHDSELRKLSLNEYVLVYKYSSAGDLHTVYVHKYDASTKMVECINSHGKNNPRPIISLQDIVKLYKVTCSAVDATTVSGKY